MNAEQQWSDGWKVVCDHPLCLGVPENYINKGEDVFYSCSCSACMMEYGVDKETRRPLDGGPLAVFDDLAYAADFVIEYKPTLNIYSCRYIRSADRGLWRPGDLNTCLHIPEGTVFADVVVLCKKEVSWRDIVFGRAESD